MSKRYINVIAEFSREGKIMPLALRSELGRKFAISRVTSIIPAASQKSGGAGLRYTCYSGSRMFYLFLEEERWFLELPDA